MFISMNYSSSISQEQSYKSEPKFKKKDVVLLAMTNDVKKHPQTVVYFVNNLKCLLDVTNISKAQLAKTSGVSARYIDFLLKYERYPTIEIAEKIGLAFGLSGWLMIMPNLNYSIAQNGKIDDLIKKFSESSLVTQSYVSEVLHRKQ